MENYWDKLSFIHVRDQCNHLSNLYVNIKGRCFPKAIYVSVEIFLWWERFTAYFFPQL